MAYILYPEQVETGDTKHPSTQEQIYFLNVQENLNSLNIQENQHENREFDIIFEIFRKISTQILSLKIVLKYGKMNMQISSNCLTP